LLLLDSITAHIIIVLAEPFVQTAEKYLIGLGIGKIGETKKEHENLFCRYRSKGAVRIQSKISDPMAFGILLVSCL